MISRCGCGQISSSCSNKVILKKSLGSSEFDACLQWDGAMDNNGQRFSRARRTTKMESQGYAANDNH